MSNLVQIENLVNAFKDLLDKLKYYDELYYKMYKKDYPQITKDFCDSLFVNKLIHNMEKSMDILGIKEENDKNTLTNIYSEGDNLKNKIEKLGIKALYKEEYCDNALLSKSDISTEKLIYVPAIVSESGDILLRGKYTFIYQEDLLIPKYIIDKKTVSLEEIFACVNKFPMIIFADNILEKIKLDEVDEISLYNELRMKYIKDAVSINKLMVKKFALYKKMENEFYTHPAERDFCHNYKIYFAQDDGWVEDSGLRDRFNKVRIGVKDEDFDNIDFKSFIINFDKYKDQVKGYANYDLLEKFVKIFNN